MCDDYSDMIAICDVCEEHNDKYGDTIYRLSNKDKIYKICEECVIDLKECKTVQDAIEYGMNQGDQSEMEAIYNIVQDLWSKSLEFARNFPRNYEAFKNSIKQHIGYSNYHFMTEIYGSEYEYMIKKIINMVDQDGNILI